MSRLLRVLGLVMVVSLAGWMDARAQGGELIVAVVKSPVTPDGNVADRPTDINVILSAPLDPQTPGRTLLRGRSIKVTLPEAFRRNPDVPAIASKDQGFLVKGWPQGDVRRGDYTVSLEGERTQVFTATDDITPGGADEPGIKVLHLRGRAFVNPPAGEYRVQVEAETGPNGAPEMGEGTITILPAIAPSINPSNALFPQPSNGNWQRTPLNTDNRLPFDFLLFNARGERDNGVGVVPADRARFPRYTGGLIVRDANGDGTLDAAVDTVIGGVIGAAPQGATGQVARTPLDPTTSKPILSGQVPDPQGNPVAGIMRVQFHTGSLPGEYAPTFELTDGNAVRMVTVGTGVAAAAQPSPIASPGPVVAQVPRELPRTGSVASLAPATATAGLVLVGLGAAILRSRKRA
ncbi:MAG: hypothetical protein IT305_31560 [Chloroflexi bacterium]|nr:hypothetical protein [Chloroflexota bacterium]